MLICIACLFCSLQTVLLLVAVLVLIFKDDKSACSSPPLSNAELANLLNDTETSASIVTTGGGGVNTTPVPPVEFTGKYELYSSENFDEFLVELEIGYFTRLAATKASSEYIITKDGDNAYTLKTISTFGQSSISFKDGVEFSEDRLDGNTVRSVITIKGNKWIQKQYHDKEVTIVREFSDKEVKVTSVVNGVASVRKYKKIE